jgi:hypothetical protein
MSRRASFTATLSKPGYTPVSVNVSHSISSAGGVAFLGNAIIGGLVGAGVDVASGAMNDLTPNGMTLALQREAFASWDGDGAQSHVVTDVVSRFELPPEGTGRYRSAPAPEGRVVELKVLANGDVEEIREVP